MKKQIANALREYGVSLTFQPEFWTDLREIARLSAVLHTRDFERIAMKSHRTFRRPMVQA